MEVKGVWRGDGDKGRRERVVLVVLFYEVGGVDICSAFPCVVTFRVSLPLDKILEVF